MQPRMVFETLRPLLPRRWYCIFRWGILTYAYGAKYLAGSLLELFDDDEFGLRVQLICRQYTSLSASAAEWIGELSGLELKIITCKCVGIDEEGEKFVEVRTFVALNSW